MNPHEKLDKLDLLTHEADMLINVLDNALNFHDDNDVAISMSHLSAIIREKLDKIRILF